MYYVGYQCIYVEIMLKWSLGDYGSGNMKWLSIGAFDWVNTVRYCNPSCVILGPFNDQSKHPYN
jgi:hypothetical protein